MRSSPAGLRAQLQRLARTFGRRWGVPLSDVTIAFNPRLRSSWGRARRDAVSLHPLLTWRPVLLEIVLCHELAHVAVFRLHGTRARPHGPEWKALVTAAGHSPDRRLPGPGTPKPTAPRSRFLHRCPVCQAFRVARRPVPGWRCATCVGQGLPGLMTITRLGK